MAKVKKPTKAALKRINSIIARYGEQKWGLIPLLQEIQQVQGYIPPEGWGLKRARRPLTMSIPWRPLPVLVFVPWLPIS